MNDMVSACGKFLANLPESKCTARELATALARFGIGAVDVERAAALLPEHYDLSYAGVRMLISEYLGEFCRIFCESGRKTCEVSVPSPQFVIMYMQSASGDSAAFRTGALFMQVVLRSFFLFNKPFAPELNRMRMCGLNRARHWLVHSEVAPELVLQFGVLCDECVKCCEGEDCRTHVVNAVFPKGTARCGDAYADAAVEMLLSAVEAELGFKPSRKDWMRALGTYLRLVKVENELAALNARRGRRPLDGNSFALAQTAELAVFCSWDGVLTALETLAGELETAPSDDGLARAYCYYTPFLHPWVDALCRRRGVRLMGSAVFLNDAKPRSLTPGAMAAAWLNGMNVRKDALAEAGQIAHAIQNSGCSAYVNGLFSFDRWLGPPAALHAEVLSRLGTPTFTLRGDFWSEQPGPGETEVESICEAITGMA